MLQEACEMLLAAAEQRRQEAIAAAEEEYRRIVEAVALIQGRNGRRESDRLSHGKLSSVILTAIDDLDGPFTVRDVEARLQDLAPDVAERVSIASISTTLRRLVGRRLSVAEPGSATRPSRYQKVS